MHVPFCVVKCGYCDFNTFAGVPRLEVQHVLAAMEREMACFEGLRPTTVFLGGGTPTHLEADDLERLLAAMHARFDLAAVVEFTCEANPESLSDEKLQIAVNKGVTRVSIGAQAFDDRRLLFLDRAHDAAEILDAVRTTRRHPVEMNLDLMFATPSHDLAAWLRELDTALALEPDHLSCYGLTFEPGTRLHADLKRGLVREAPEDSARELLLATRQRLRDAGFVAYEVSNYSRPGRECRHNLHYWRAGDYLGVGPGAASHFGGRRWTNVRALGAYCAAMADASSAAHSAETLPPVQRGREAIWLGLRLAEGADLVAIQEATGADALAIAAAVSAGHEQQGLTERVGARLRVTERGFPFTDTIAAAYL